MKKVFFIFAIASLLTACNNNADTAKETKDSPKEIPPPDDSISKMKNEPSHDMMQHDTTGRRPRD